MNIEAKSLKLPDYSVSFVPNDSCAAICNLDVGSYLRLFCRITYQNSMTGTSDIDVNINSVDSKLRKDNLIYIGRIKRILMSVVDLTRFEKTKMKLDIDIVHKRVTYDIYHHLLNLISITMVYAKIDMKMLFIASSCFVKQNKDIVSEEQMTEIEVKQSTQAFLCKDLTSNDSLISFKINGNLKDNSQMVSLFGTLMGMSNQIGKKLVEFLAEKSKQ